MKKDICFVTTGDIKDIATAKRALGLANPLANHGWNVSIIIEDTAENRHRIALECNSKIKIYYFPKSNVFNERKIKNTFIKQINPSFLYICAFVTRNIVGIMHQSKKLVEHSELQSAIFNIGRVKRFANYILEYSSIIYSDGIINASKYLELIYHKRSKHIKKTNIKMLYLPYAYNPTVINIKKIDYTNQKWNQYKEKKCFVFLGSIVENYGVFTILQAAKDLIKEDITNFKILLLGKGKDYKKAIDYVENEKLSDYVDLPGYVKEEEISDYFSLAAGFISPMNNTIQDWARCPSKLYMYLPYNKPILTCKIGEPYEVLKENGYYFEIGNSKSLANQIKIAITENKEIIADPFKHTWECRAKEFNTWIERNYLI